MNKSKNGILGKIALFLAAFIWGTSFVVVKNSVDVFSPLILLGFRFTIGTLFVGLIFFKRMKKINIEYIIHGSIMGVFLFSAYTMQTIGITDTTPGKNAFLTSIYCVLVPFLFWIIDKKKPTKYNFIAAFLCVAGIGLVSLSGDLSIRMGDAYTLVGGVLYAAHIVATAKFTKAKDPIVLTVVQFAMSAVLSWVFGLGFEKMPTNVDTNAILSLLFLGFFATGVALLCQNIGQKYSDPSSASIILSLEAVFGVAFSIMLYDEVMTFKLVLGFVLIFVAVIVSEVFTSSAN